MTYCSTASLAANSTLQIVLRIVEIFTSTCAGKFYEQMVALIQSRSLELHYQTFTACQFHESNLFIYLEELLVEERLEYPEVPPVDVCNFRVNKLADNLLSFSSPFPLGSNQISITGCELFLL